MVAKLHLNKPKDFWSNVLWTDKTKTELFGPTPSHYSKSVQTTLSIITLHFFISVLLNYTDLLNYMKNIYIFKNNVILCSIRNHMEQKVTNFV